MNKITRAVYYRVKPFVPRRFQVFLRVKEVALKRARYSDAWPILEGTDQPPPDWKGWPEGKKFALILTHDVDTARGHDRCRNLMKLEKKLGLRSLFNLVPERYTVSSQLRNELEKNGFEIGVHGLNHDGKLFQSKAMFEERAVKINQYLKQWNAVGFRAPAMHHNLDWMAALNIEYDLSTFDTDPFEPQSDGVKTIYPFVVDSRRPGNGYIEMPYSLAQDFTLFILMQEPNIDIWTKKLDWIAERGGMALINTHPDYMNFGEGKPSFEEYPAAYYQQFLEYVLTKFKGQYWHVLPRTMASFWRSRLQSNVQT